MKGCWYAVLVATAPPICIRRYSRQEPRKHELQKRSKRGSARLCESDIRAVDTNVLVRLIARDDRKQLQSGEDFVSKGAWVSHLVLAETVWVLDSVFGLQSQQIATAVEMLLNHEHLTIQDAEVVGAALESFRKHRSVSFTDCLIVAIARKYAHVPVGTFDRDLARIEGTQRL
jgi:predicted nucleic-acid-binding protein